MRFQTRLQLVQNNYFVTTPETPTMFHLHTPKGYVFLFIGTLYFQYALYLTVWPAIIQQSRDRSSWFFLSKETIDIFLVENVRQPFMRIVFQNLGECDKKYPKSQKKVNHSYTTPS